MPNTEQLAQLRQLFTERFGDSDLRTFCFDLGVDYEDLPGASKADKARELVAYMQRRGRLDELIQAGRRARPDVPWPEPSAAGRQPVAGGTPTPTADHGAPALSVIKRRALERRLVQLAEEYEAVNQQLSYTLSAVDRIRIQRQAEVLEAEISQADAELKALG
jgi:hypothetical protein